MAKFLSCTTVAEHLFATHPGNTLAIYFEPKHAFVTSFNHLAVTPVELRIGEDKIEYPTLMNMYGGPTRICFPVKPSHFCVNQDQSIQGFLIVNDPMESENGHKYYPYTGISETDEIFDNQIASSHRPYNKWFP